MDREAVLGGGEGVIMPWPVGETAGYKDERE